MSKIVLIDLDGVLFNSGSFRAEYFYALKSLRFDPEVIQRTYQEARTAGYYDADFHLNLLIGNPRDTLQLEYLRRTLREKIEARGQNYVFEGAHKFLEDTRAPGRSIYLLSAGTPWFQEAKIHAAGFYPLVDKVIVTPEPFKTTAFSNLRIAQAERSDKDYILIDDSAAVIDMFSIYFPEVVTLRLLHETDPEAGNKIRTALSSAVYGSFQEVKDILFYGFYAHVD